MDLANKEGATVLTGGTVEKLVVDAPRVGILDQLFWRA